MDSIRTTSGDTNKSVEVEKIENGYLICRYKSWTDDDGNYQHETKKYFSKINPLEDVEIPLTEAFDVED